MTPLAQHLINSSAMNQLHSTIHSGVLNPESLLTTLGTWSIPVACLFLFLECGIIFLGFLPGDSLLFAIGLMMASDYIKTSPLIVLPILMVAAFAGNATGYWTGQKIGPRIFNRPESKFFKKENVEKTEAFFLKYGPRAIIFARFVPIVRSVITSLAGVGRMDYRKFITFSAVGAVAWISSLIAAGFFLGEIPFVKKNIEIITLTLVVVVHIALGLEVWRQSKT